MEEKMAQDSSNYYELLGATEGFTCDEINSLYRKRSRECHPDKASSELDRRNREKDFKKLQAAHGVLGDVHRRALYDQWRRSGLQEMISWEQWEQRAPIQHWHGERPALPTKDPTAHNTAQEQQRRQFRDYQF